MKKFYLVCIIITLTTAFGFAQSPIPENAVLEKIAGGFQFVEGPVWNDTTGLLFSDLSGNKVYKWTEEDSIKIFLNPSANSNGLTYDLQGRLLLAQTGLRRIARMEADGSQTSLADTFNGKKLNSPNDLTVKSDGSIFFTDPPFNIPSGQQQELSFSGIFRISPYGELQLLDSSLSLPNGICFSPDETKLYVNNSQARIIYVWDVVDDSIITNKREFARIIPNGYADGMKVDSSGNVFCTGPQAVWIYSSNGTYLDTIRIPGQSSPSNCNWGDTDRKTLYITAGSSVYRIRLAAATGIKNQGNFLREFELFQNYPNPFNVATNFGFRISNFSERTNNLVTIKIYDMLGKEIATLINKEFSPGVFQFQFSMDDFKLPSGIYFYQMGIGNFAGSGKIFTQTKKFVLLK